jgi:NADH-quinone oxidoreductase subunit G
MTFTDEQATDAPPVEMVTLTIDDQEVSVPKGTLVIRAAELIGVQIPRFCDHPLLDPVGACRQCLVEVEGQRKPMASCTITVTPDMVVRTQHTSAAADKAQHGVMELLLINHPLDCPVCDKGGECPLQNQAMSNGRAETRFTDVKRTFPKPINLSAEVLLDRERCVLCARCTRFSGRSGDLHRPRGARGVQQVGSYADQPYDSYFSGQRHPDLPRRSPHQRRLPLPGASVRPRERGVELRALRGRVRAPRRPPPLPGEAPPRRRRPRRERGVELRRRPLRFRLHPGRRPHHHAPRARRDRGAPPASWPEAIDAAVAGLRSAGSSVGVLAGGRLTVERPTPTRSSPAR